MKTSPANGSARSACWTRAARPSMPFLKSTGRAASRMRTPAGPPGGCAPRAGPRSRQPPQHLEHPAQRRHVDVRADTDDGRAERDLDPARRPGRCRGVLRDHYPHELGRFACCRCRELLAPDEQLARVQPVAARHRRDRARRVEALGHDPGLLLVGPAASPTDAGDHLEPAEAVVVRTGDTTIITHGSRTRAFRFGSFILVVISRPARCPSDNAYEGTKGEPHGEPVQLRAFGPRRRTGKVVF